MDSHNPDINASNNGEQATIIGFSNSVTSPTISEPPQQQPTIEAASSNDSKPPCSRSEAKLLLLANPAQQKDFPSASPQPSGPRATPSTSWDCMNIPLRPEDHLIRERERFNSLNTWPEKSVSGFVPSCFADMDEELETDVAEETPQEIADSIQLPESTGHDVLSKMVIPRSVDYNQIVDQIVRDRVEDDVERRIKDSDSESMSCAEDEEEQYQSYLSSAANDPRRCHTSPFVEGGPLHVKTFSMRVDEDEQYQSHVIPEPIDPGTYCTSPFPGEENLSVGIGPIRVDDYRDYPFVGRFGKEEDGKQELGGTLEEVNEAGIKSGFPPLEYDRVRESLPLGSFGEEEDGKDEPGVTMEN